jgi:hypothetical protein
MTLLFCAWTTSGRVNNAILSAKIKNFYNTRKTSHQLHIQHPVSLAQRAFILHPASARSAFYPVSGPASNKFPQVNHYIFQKP